MVVDIKKKINFSEAPQQSLTMQFYYVNTDGQQAGPIDISELKKAGINANTLVWREGMAEWQPAGNVKELSSLFIPVPPPPPPLPSKTVSVPASKNNLRKFLLPAAGILILLVIGVFLFSGKKTDDNNLARTLNADTLQIEDEDSSDKAPVKKDSVKLIDLDTFANKLNWDTTATVVDSSLAETGNAPVLPGFGTENNKSDRTKSASKKTTSRKKANSNTEEKTEPEPERVRENPSPQPERINPVRMLSANGNFRKNLLFEAILEGTIFNRSTVQVRDVVLEVRFLDASGQTIGTKKFMQAGAVPAASSAPFRFKANAPKGAKGAAFQVVDATVR